MPCFVTCVNPIMIILAQITCQLYQDGLIWAANRMETEYHNNIFRFLNRLYRQQKDTFTGACLAPNYANLFLVFWEKKYVYLKLNRFKDKMIWHRYIANILLLFSGSED